MSRTLRPFNSSSSSSWTAATRGGGQTSSATATAENDLDQVATEQQQQQQLSREDLRQRRLAALQRGSSSTRTTTTSSTTTTTTTTKTAHSSRRKRPPPPPTTARKSEVIDLCESSSSSSEDETAKPPSAGAAVAVTIRNPYRRNNNASRRGASTTVVTAASRNSNSSEDEDLVQTFRSLQNRKKARRSEKKQNTNTQSTSSSKNIRHTISFQIATYNIWFQVSVHPVERMQALGQALLSQHTSSSNTDTNPLLFIALQEVITPLDDLLFSSLAHTYKFVQQPCTQVPYGCALALHKDLHVIESGFRPFTNTIMSRGIVFARVRLPTTLQQQQQTTTTTEILLTTTHLESWTGPQYTGSLQRHEQIHELEDFCQRQLQQHDNCQLAIITGDLNWDDAIRRNKKTSGPDPVLLSHLRNPSWRDVWLDCFGSTTSSSNSNNNKEGYTYDAKLNPMLGGYLRRRFDRILILENKKQQHQPKCQVQHAKLIGKDALPGLTWNKTYKNRSTRVPVAPSDHFGLVAHLELSASS